jgi:hypothetical protein
MIYDAYSAGIPLPIKYQRADQVIMYQEPDMVFEDDDDDDELAKFAASLSHGCS